MLVHYGKVWNSGDEDLIAESIAICKTLGEIGIKREDWGWILDIIWFFEDFGKILVEKDTRISLLVLYCLEEFWKESIKYKRKLILYAILNSVKEIGETAKNRRSRKVYKRVCRYLHSKGC